MWLSSVKSVTVALIGICLGAAVIPGDAASPAVAQNETLREARTGYFHLSNTQKEAALPIPLTWANARKHGHTKLNYNQLLGAVGFVICDNQPYYGFQASIVGVNGQILTVAHVIVDENGKSKKYSNCIFKTEFDQVELDLDDIYIGTASFYRFPGKDFAFIRLTRDVRNANPIPIIDSSLFNIDNFPSVFAVNLGEWKGKIERIFRPISYKRFSNTYVNTIHFLGSSMQGNSGGLQYYIDNKGRIVALGMTQSGTVSQHFLPYNDSLLNKSTPLSYNRAVGLREEVLMRMEEFANGRPLTWAD